MLIATEGVECMMDKLLRFSKDVPDPDTLYSLSTVAACLNQRSLCVVLAWLPPGRPQCFVAAAGRFVSTPLMAL